MKKFLLNTKYFWITLILIFIFARLATWFYPFDSDHWIFFYVGKMIALGKTLYIDVWDHKPPVPFLINSLMYFAFGANIIWHRIFLTLWAIAEIFIFYKLAKLIIKTNNPESDTYLARLSVLIFTLLENLSQFTSSGNNTENFALLFLLLTYWIYWLGKNKIWNLVLAGVFFSLIIFLKPTFVLLGLPILIEMIINRKNWLRFVKNFIIFAIPTILQTGFWIWYFWQKHALNDFWIAAVSFSSKYSKAAWIGHVSERNIFILIMIPFLVMYLIVLWPYLKNIKKILQDNILRFLILAAFIALVLGIMAGSFYPYYFLLSIMPLSLLAANPIFLDFIKGKKLLIIIIALCLLANIGISYKEFYNSFSGSVQKDNLENQEIADYIKDNSNKNDKIIAYTYGATFYTLADREDGSRYISASHLLLDERENFGYNFDDKFIADIEKNKPKYCLFPSDPDSVYLQNKKAAQYLLDNFEIVKEFPDYYVMKSKTD